MPNRDKPSLAALLAVVLCLGACATTSENTQEEEALEAERRLSSIASALPGRYASVVDSDVASRVLVIERRSSDRAGTLALELRQSGGGSAVRRFGLTIQPSNAPLMLEGVFAPLDENGRARGSCAMTFHLREGGLVGRTDERDCRFGQEGQATGLLKEIAFDGRQLVIGDRLVRLDDGTVMSEQVLTFLPTRTYEARLGRREGDSWRVSRDVSLTPGAPPVQPLDEADMQLGVSIGLDYFRPGSDAPVMLRLSVKDADTGEAIADAWAGARANSFGITLPSLQVGVERRAQP
ncbi:MAG: hypothetical protein GVY32_02395 [Gammaproteobacteria bacterium]|jgi:hypothetical protein|nr:hypothetical protein [Gammaproteobacteria bacterium]